MVGHLPAPGVEHGGEADACGAEEARVARQLLEGARGGAEERRIRESLMRAYEGPELLGQGEGQEEVGHVEAPSGLLGEPAVVLGGLALGTVAVATGTRRLVGAATTVAVPANVSELAGAAGHPVYWVGTRPGTKLEGTLLDNGNAYVRYLGANAAIGDPEPNFLTVGTYPVPNAYAALKDASKQPGAVVKQAPRNGLVVTNTSSPNSVYVAYRDQDLQIEVYDPNPRQARQLATSGAVTPVD